MQFGLVDGLLGQVIPQHILRIDGFHDRSSIGRFALLLPHPSLVAIHPIEDSLGIVLLAFLGSVMSLLEVFEDPLDSHRRLLLGTWMDLPSSQQSVEQGHIRFGRSEQFKERFDQ